jgi:hypothetical protein
MDEIWAAVFERKLDERWNFLLGKEWHRIERGAWGLDKTSYAF